ncbi:GDYXXLXY domain-containing protein [uncultured Roseibium sp.]|uniref:GDYXXLXY domain-containing protein n=1 Tax=uncultured Roseibium sp. TaxID=1936171 RepID=UPI0026182539|nr:GDYXXLXY domain-containing protein [uncultured Roseibium sp.]
MSAETVVPGEVGRPLFQLTMVRWGLLALIQLALISLPLVDRLQVQFSGETERLALDPVDPRDLLRGDYVIINLAISRLAKDLPGADTVQPGDTVFVSLRSETPAALPTRISKQPEEAGAMAIKGFVLSVTDRDIRIDYGIDAFFVPEGEGKIIETLDTDRMLLEVAITDDGRSLPLTLLVDGKTFRSDGTF